MLARALLLMGSIAAIVLLFFVNLTTPTSAGPLGILVVFVCVYCLFLVALTFSTWSLYKFSGRILSSFAVRRPVGTLSLLRAYYFSSVLALGPVMLISMQSVQKVNIYEFSLVVLFMLIASVYIAKRTS